MSITHDLSCPFLLSVLFSDFTGTLFLMAETPPDCSGGWGASPLLQCDVQLAPSTRLPLLLG